MPRELYLVDNQTTYQYPTTRQELEDRVLNFKDCLNSDGRFKINGTKYIWFEELPNDLTHLRMTAYGGYELGGRGCFYQEVT